MKRRKPPKQRKAQIRWRRRREAERDAAITAAIGTIFERAKPAGMTTEELDALKDEFTAPNTDGLARSNQSMQSPLHEALVIRKEARQ